MAQPYPISRESREEAVFLGDGGAVYGPFDLKIFDIDDVEVWTKVSGGNWTIAAPTVAKVDPAAAFDEFTITFAANVALTTKIKVLSARVHERSASITAGTKLSPDALEKELTKQGTILQELRRDVDRAVKMEFEAGASALALAAAIGDGKTLVKSGGRLIEGPDAAQIASAEGYATAANAARVAAQVAQAAAEAAAAAFRVSTRTELKALNTTYATTAYLVEAGREGMFVWKTGNYSARIAADTAEGKYIKADAIPSTAGAWVRITKIRTPEMFGATGIGNTSVDDTVAINLAAASASSDGGGVLLLTGRYYVSGTVAIPRDVRVDGVSQNRDAWIEYPDFATIDDDRSHLIGNGLLIRSATSRIVMGPNTSIRNVRTVGEWCTVPPRSDLDNSSVLTKAAIAAWPAGSIGVEVGGNDVIIENNTIVGFRTGVVSSGYERARIVSNNIDSHTGIEATGAGDVVHISGNQIMPLYPRDWPDSSGVVTQRLGSAIYLHDVVDTAIVTNNFGYGFAIGLYLANVYAIQSIGNRFDNSALGQQNYPMGETVAYFTTGLINSCFTDAALCDGYYMGLKATHTDGHLAIGTLQIGSVANVKAFIGKDASVSADRFVMAGDTVGALVEFEAGRTTEASIREIILSYFTGVSNVFSFAAEDVRKIHIGKVLRGGTSTSGNANNFPEEILEVVFSVSAGVVTVLGARGVSSVGRFSDGVFLINFTNNQPDTVYTVEMSAQRGTSGHMICSLAGGAANAKNINNVQVTVVNPSNALEDPAFMSVTIKRV